jgi:hypothetical protein
VSSRTLNAQHQPRTQSLPNVGKHSPDRYEARVSRADEATLATRARRKRVVQVSERLEHEYRALIAVMKADPALCSKQIQQDYGKAVAMLGKGRSKLSQLPQ